MRSVRLLTLGALSASLILPAGILAASPAGVPFTASVNAKAYTNTRVVPLTAGRTGLPAGTTFAGWFLSETGSPNPLPGAAGWKEAPTTFTVSNADGEHTIYVWAKAKPGGIVSSRGSDTTFLDRVAPVVDSVETVPAQAEAPDDPLLDRPTIDSRTVSLTFEWSDPGEDAEPATGSGALKYAVVNGTTAPVPGSDAWKNLPVAADLTVTHKTTSGNGNKTVSVFVRDRAANVSLAASVYFKLQIAGPTVTISQLADYTKTNKPTLKLVAKNGSGVTLQDAMFLAKVNTTGVTPDAPLANAAGWKTAISSVTLPGEGTNHIYAWAKDSNGSISALPATDTIIWDNDAPAGNFAINELENGGGVDTTTDRVIDILSIADDGSGSGVAKYALMNGVTAPTLASDWKNLPIPGTHTLPLKNGTKNVSLFLKDNAGNIAGPFTDNVIMTIPAPSLVFNIVKLYSNSLTVNIAADPTDTGGTGIPSFGYMVKEADVTPLATDSGWKALSTQVLTAGQGVRTLYAWVKDNNGSVSAVSSDSVFIDTVKPLATLTAVGTTLTVGGSDTGGSGITDYAVVITTGATPAIPSAPASNSTAWKTTAGAAVSSVTAAVGNRATVFTRDAAGNVSNVDSTDPDVNTLILVAP